MTDAEITAALARSKNAKIRRQFSQPEPEAQLNQRLYTYQEVADLLKLHDKTVSRLFRNRSIFRLNHSTVRITQAQLDKFLQEHTCTSSNPSPPGTGKNTTGLKTDSSSAIRPKTGAAAGNAGAKKKCVPVRSLKN